MLTKKEKSALIVIVPALIGFVVGLLWEGFLIGFNAAGSWLDD